MKPLSTVLIAALVFFHGWIDALLAVLVLLAGWSIIDAIVMKAAGERHSP